MKLNKNLFFICAGLSASFLYGSENSSDDDLDEFVTHIIGQTAPVDSTEKVLYRADLSLMEKHLNEGGSPYELIPYCYYIGKTLISSKGFPLHIAAAHGDTRIAQLALDKGTDINKRFDYYSAGDTPLTRAVHNDQKGMVKWLLQKGVDVTNEDNTHALIDAISRENREILSLLIENKMDINSTFNERSVLQITCAGAKVNEVEFLLKNGSNVNYVGKDRSTALSSTVDELCCPSPGDQRKRDPRDFYKIFELLLEYGADVTSKSVIKDGVCKWNLLNTASSIDFWGKTRYKVMKALLIHGLVPTKKFLNGLSKTIDDMSTLKMQFDNFDEKELRRLQDIEKLANLNVKNNLLEEVKAVQQEQIALLKERAELLRVEKIASLTDKNN